ncbi:MAG: tol-pal system protein YbgF [Deltaproteobacteria bacterium]|nr:tol-pal system protein YbgF [Deltaproteobacteria bacterium]
MTEEDYARLTDRVTTNSRDISSLVNEVNDLRAQTKLRNAELERQLTDQSAKTSQGLPEVHLELDRMRAEVQRLTNVVEISQRRKTINESESKTLTAELHFIKLRLDRLEATLSLSPLKSAPVASRPEALPEKRPTAVVTPAREKPSPEPEKIKVKPAPKPPTPEEEYKVAESLFKKELYQAAFGKFQDFVKKYPRSSMAPTAQFYAGECLYQQQRYEEAILEYQKVIKKYGRSQRVSNALLKQAFSFNYIGDKTSAKLLLQKLAREYPATYSGKVAKERLSQMK